MSFAIESMLIKTPASLFKDRVRISIPFSTSSASSFFSVIGLVRVESSPIVVITSWTVSMILQTSSFEVRKYLLYMYVYMYTQSSQNRFIQNI